MKNEGNGQVIMKGIIPLFYDETPETFRKRLAVFVLWAIFGSKGPGVVRLDRLTQHDIVLPALGTCSVLYIGMEGVTRNSAYKPGLEVEIDGRVFTLVCHTWVLYIRHLRYLYNCNSLLTYRISGKMFLNDVYDTHQKYMLERADLVWRYLEVYACLAAAYPAAGDRCLLRALFDAYLGPFGAFSLVIPVASVIM
jgi:hypothetical protein